MFRDFFTQTSKNTILIQYFRSESQRRIYKLAQENDRTFLYWVTVWKVEDGTFHHGRGADRLANWEKGLELCQLLAVEATEEDYITGLKDYFAADKNVREQFIQKYNL